MHTTPKAAKAAGDTHYFTGRPCANGHQALRDIRGACTACYAVHQAKHRARHPEKQKERRKALDAFHRAYSAEWYLRNKQKVNERNQQWRAANRERNCKVNAEWKKANPGKVASYAAKRRALELRATPPWANLEGIEALYLEAAARRAAGENVEVDHMFPLLGKTVCGLHTADNLWVIPARENRSKGNRVHTYIAPIPALDLA